MLLSVRTVVIALAIVVAVMPRSVMRAQRFAQEHPDISGDSDGRHAWMTAVYRDLIVRKLTNPAKGMVSIDLRHRLDAVTIMAHADGTLTIRRAKRTVVVDSPESLEASRSLLADSEAVQHLLDVARVMVVRSVPEAALLATIGFVRVLAGETGSSEESIGQALTSRAWMRSNKRDRCALAYAATNGALLENVQTCVGDGESGNSPLACHSQWFVEAEASWFDYLTCSWPVMQTGD
jgi:hypothetical protein